MAAPLRRHDRALSAAKSGASLTQTPHADGRAALMEYEDMRAVLKSLDLEPDPSTLSADPAEFSLLARVIVGESGTSGEESFDVTVCTPEWLAEACKRDGGVYNPRHHLVVDFDQFDARVLRAWLAARVQEVQAETWAEVGERLGRLGHWEFEDYRD